MTFRSIVLVIVAAAVMTAGALAGTAAKNPLKLALQASDMPANLSGFRPRPLLQDPATVAILGVPGVRAADYTYSWPADPKVNDPAAAEKWLLQGTVFVAPDPRRARDLFARGSRPGPAYGTGFFGDVPGGNHAKVGLPSYGEKQTAVYVRRFRCCGPQAIVFVLKGAVVWQLRIAPVSLKWNVTKTQVLTELKKYALKQKARVGSG